jgi:hypothetical protein
MANNTNQPNPKFIKNTPQGIDKYEGKSAERVAQAVLTHIDHHDGELPHIIGLEGAWGSGKSNVIEILAKQGKINKFHIFLYDAWAYQEELHRRSFLETLTNDLIKAKVVSGKTPLNVNGDSNEMGTWTEKLKYLLAKKSETETVSYPKLGYGVIFAYFNLVLLPFFFFVANEYGLSFGWRVFILLLPLIVLLTVWRCAAWKNPKMYRNIGFLLALYQNKVKEDKEFKVLTDSEPSIADFRTWMSNVSDSLKDGLRLIIVFDNMDRLPADKVKQLWSSIHTFFAETGYSNIWTIISFDKKHLSNAFTDKTNESDLICHFINKTFPVIYRIAPPVLTDWRKVFDEYFEEAFNENQSQAETKIRRYYGVIKKEITPREIISFINELVALNSMWNGEIPLPFIAIYVLTKDEIIPDPVNKILNGSYLKQLGRIDEDGDEIQKYISALTYGIDVKHAEQIPLKKYLHDIFNDSTTKYDINAYSNNKHFNSFLDDELNDINPDFLDGAIAILSKLTPEKQIDVEGQWNKLAKLQTQKQIIFTFEESYKSLLLYTNEATRIEFVKYLCGGYRMLADSFSEFGGGYYTVMHSLDLFIDEYKFNISTDELLTSQMMSVEAFINYVREARADYKKYKIFCDNDKLNDTIINWIHSETPTNMEFVSFLVNDEKYSFERMKSKLEDAIKANKITIVNFPDNIMVYKSISKEKPLNVQFNPAQIQIFLKSFQDHTLPAYYELVAMGLTQSIDTPYVLWLDEEVAKRIEYYCELGDLFALVVKWGSDLLIRTLRIIVADCDDDSSLDIVTVLPIFEALVKRIGVNESMLLNKLDGWSGYAGAEIDVSNILTVIPNSSFYEHSTKTKNQLTNHINKIAFEKLKTIPFISLYEDKNSPTNYWLTCARCLIQGGTIIQIPDNLIEFSQKIVTDIGEATQPIPDANGSIDVILKTVETRQFQPTINTLTDRYCNNQLPITPKLFIYLSENFAFLSKVSAREDAIVRSILTEVITDSNCLRYILDNAERYITIINKADADAEAFKLKIRQLLSSNSSLQLKQFAIDIGIGREEIENDRD